jgi:hypothetical protein
MKKLFTLLIMSLVLSSCTDANNGLTKALALQNIKACDAENPVEFIKGIYVGKMTYQNAGTSLVELGYIKKLAKSGIVVLDSLSSSNQQMSDHIRINTVYNVSIKPEYKKHITKQKDNIAYVRLVSREVQEVTSITLKNDVRADVMATFKKIKTPFYDIQFDQSTRLKTRQDVFTEVIGFNKSNKDGWTSCFLKENKQ